ncbi:trem-like transcript 4 protein isoform X2 [Talpa occidentalis]|uniref:trem-like transcript 4 protein isoform X2 n=1 Tax=Talpa occidentalis TaxID=50954 RepID=UPI00188EE34D|nr:trem-like transcript 4 protein isoform X2 [Talpa occidentalis]
MAWGTPHLFLPPVLLVLLASGSWAESAPEVFHGVVGDTFTVQCVYTPDQGPYRPKSWCLQTKPGWCNRVVTSSKPRASAQDSRHVIWDAPDIGIVTILTIQMKENDTGIYWCGSYNASSNKITIFKKFNLIVSPATTTSPVMTSTWLPSTTVPVTSPEGTFGPPSTHASEPRNFTFLLSRGSAASTPLVTMLCGLLVAKVLALCSWAGGPATGSHL